MTHEKPVHVHRPTVFLLVLIVGVFLWLNLRPTEYQVTWTNLPPPGELDTLTRGLFYPGWPLSPCTICLFHGMKWHPEESFCWLALVLDVLVALLVLAAVGLACEWFMGSWQKAEDLSPEA